MNAKLVLQLWRERWGKGREGLPNKRFVRGSIFKWAEDIPKASAWSTPGLSIAVFIVSVLFLLLSISIEFSLNGQISFAGLMVVAALFLRRYDGALITLALFGLSVLCTAQYFVWRFGVTLGAYSDARFFVPFTLCSIELCVAFYFLVGWLTRLWPIEQEEVELLLTGNDRPAVDIVLHAATLDEARVMACVRACAAINWPAKKLKLYVIDGEPRAALEEQLLPFAVVYRSQDKATESLLTNLSMLHETVATATGEFLVALDMHSRPAQDFLERALGWFESDSGLAMLYSADHPWAPRLSDHLEVDQVTSAGDFSFAMLRRSSWTGELASVWRRSALVIERTEPIVQDLFSTRSHQLARMIRIDRGDSSALLSWKRRLIEFHRLLQFYRPVAYCAFLLAPVVFLLQGMTLIHAKPDWFACFALPTLVLIGVVQSRNTQEGRWDEFREIKELMLSTYMLLATARSYLLTACLRPYLIVARWRAELSLAQWSMGLLLFLILVLNLAAVFTGVFLLFTQEPQLRLWTVAYVAWSFANVLLLLSRQAIFQEASEIKSFAQKQQNLQAMVRLPFGRTLACQTVNFPAAELGLLTPIPFSPPQDDALSLSIFHNNQAFSLTVQVLRTEGSTTYVRPSAAQGSELSRLRDAVFARGADWPMWLAHREADHPLPFWLSNFLSSVPIKMLDVSMNLGQYLRLNVLVQMWKSRK